MNTGRTYSSVNGVHGAFRDATYASALTRPAPTVPVARYVIAVLCVLLAIHLTARFL
jgi:hypothetical protein